MKYLIVVDMQNDFVDGALGTKEALAIVPNVCEKIRNAKKEDTVVLFTKDTHGADYLDTQEGINLPVPHCIYMTDGWQINQAVFEAWQDYFGENGTKHEFGSRVLIKNTFGSLNLVRYLMDQSPIDEIEIVGLCGDICVVSNALLLKAYFTEVPITVDASCCAGVTPEKNNAAMETMASCQIHIVGR